jgi:hypothetical protein
MEYNKHTEKMAKAIKRALAFKLTALFVGGAIWEQK